MEEQKNKWRELQERVNEAIESWRRDHPEATLTEIEEAVDVRIAEMRAQMIQDVAHTGRSAKISNWSKEERPKCPRCGQSVVANGTGVRKLKTTHGQQIKLERQQGYCQSCGLTFFPSG